MTRYLLDTNIWIYLMRNRPPQVRQRFARLKPDSVVMSPVVLGELHLGWRKSAKPDDNRMLPEQYTQLVNVAPIDDAVASTYAEIRAELEMRGTPIGGNDLWIAAQARERNCILVTNNMAEFQGVPGLRLEDWVTTQ